MDRSNESRVPFVLGLLLLASLIGGAAYWFFSEDQTPVATTTPITATIAMTNVAEAPMALTTVNLDRRVFFGYNEADLDVGTRQVLDQWADRLVADKLITLHIEGHADERGTAGYNLKLGTNRGNAVRDYLVGKGIKAPRLKVVSFGEGRPATTGHSESAWASNRRVEMRIGNVVSQR